MAVRRLFDNLEIDWRHLTLPARDRSRHRVEPSESDPCSRTILPEDLASVRSLLRLYRQVVDRGLMPDCEGSLMAFLATAAHCRRVGEKPTALLAYCLKHRVFPATLADEDRAYAALKAYRATLHPPGSWLKSRSPVEAGPRPGTQPGKTMA